MFRPLSRVYPTVETEKRFRQIQFAANVFLVVWCKQCALGVTVEFHPFGQVETQSAP